MEKVARDELGGWRQTPNPKGFEDQSKEFGFYSNCKGMPLSVLSRPYELTRTLRRWLWCFQLQEL